MVAPSHLQSKSLPRRVFIAAIGKRTVGLALATHVSSLAILASCADDRARGTTLTVDELRTLRAFAAQIIPSDASGGGATEANASEFVDRALARPLYAPNLPVVRAGLADLDQRAQKAAGARNFASASSAQQLTVLRGVASTPFFTTTRTLVVIGTFCDPSHGGNRNGVAWAMLGIDHKPSYSPPYGWYDAPPIAKAS